MVHPVEELFTKARQLTAKQWTFILIIMSGIMVALAAVVRCFPALVSSGLTRIFHEVNNPTDEEAPIIPDDGPRPSRVVDLSTLNYDHKLADLRETFADGRPMNLKPFRSKGERICAQTLMTIFDEPFVSVRPSWLKNPLTGRNLELDCYNEELALAVEYNGIQHYEAGHFGDANELRKQQGRDNVKEGTCGRHGVLLIVVPYTVSHAEIPGYIAEKIPALFRKKTVYFKGG